MVVWLLVSNLFSPTIERAFELARTRDWTGAAAALDMAAAEDPALFTANSFPYLRGRIAENQADWTRARLEFLRIGFDNPLRPLAVWHAALAAARVQDFVGAEQLLGDACGSSREVQRWHVAQ